MIMMIMRMMMMTMMMLMMIMVMIIMLMMMLMLLLIMMMMIMMMMMTLSFTADGLHFRIPKFFLGDFSGVCFPTASMLTFFGVDTFLAFIGLISEKSFANIPQSFMSEYDSNISASPK